MQSQQHPKYRELMPLEVHTSSYTAERIGHTMGATSAPQDWITIQAMDRARSATVTSDGQKTSKNGRIFATDGMDYAQLEGVGGDASVMREEDELQASQPFLWRWDPNEPPYALWSFGGEPATHVRDRPAVPTVSAPSAPSSKRPRSKRKRSR